MFWIIFSLFGLLAVIWLSWRYKNRRLLAFASKIPGPPTLPGLGNAVLFMCHHEEIVRVMKDLISEYGGVLRFWLGPDLNLVVSEPQDLKLLLSSPKASFKGPQYKYMTTVIGGGILSGSGPKWRKHRKIATPNYGKRAIESYGDVFNHEVDLLLEKLRISSGHCFDIYKIIVQTTSYSVCRTLMGLSKEQTMNLPFLQEVIDETPLLYDIVFDRMTKWYLQIDPVYWLTNSYKQQMFFIMKINDFGRTILNHRINHLKTLKEQNKIDLMNLEEDSLKNTEISVIDRFILSEELDVGELLNETFTVFTSSQEASAKISSFMLLMMAFHPDCQEKLYSEIKTITGTEDRPVTEDDLKRMPYLEMVFKEVVRLFPIGAMLQRSIQEDIDISVGTVPAGTSLVVPIYHLHRDPRFWRHPDDFDPERFSPENMRSRHPYCYIPFSLGPMDCLGRYFGTKLIKTICVRVLREFQLSTPKSYKELKVAMEISVASVEGYHVKITPRAK